MKISELDMNSRKISLKARVVDLEQPREVVTKFGRTRVAEATIEDETGQFTLVLWGDEVDKVMIGKDIEIENGYIKEFQGRLQLSVGKYGKLSVVE
jgi:ssDNA-binding replication factor A large subunit